MPSRLTRELRSLGMKVEANQSNHKQNQIEDQELESPRMANPISAQHMSPFHNAIDLTTDSGKKFFIAATKGLDNKYDGKPTGMLPFLKRMQEQGEKFGFASIAQNIPKDGKTINFFKNPGSITKEDMMAYYNPFYANDTNADNVQQCVKLNLLFLTASNSILDRIIKDMRPHESD